MPEFRCTCTGTAHWGLRCNNITHTKGSICNSCFYHCQVYGPANLQKSIDTAKINNLKRKRGWLHRLLHRH